MLRCNLKRGCRPLPGPFFISSGFSAGRGFVVLCLKVCWFGTALLVSSGCNNCFVSLTYKLLEVSGNSLSKHAGQPGGSVKTAAMTWLHTENLRRHSDTYKWCRAHKQHTLPAVSAPLSPLASSQTTSQTSKASRTHHPVLLGQSKSQKRCANVGVWVIALYGLACVPPDIRVR